MIDVSMMTSEARAAAAIDQQDTEARQERIREETFRQEHIRGMAATGQQLIEAQERAKRKRVALAAGLAGQCRICRDRLAALVAQRQTTETRIGHLRADLTEAAKTANRCRLDEPYPTDAERAAHDQRHRELGAAVTRLRGLIDVATGEHRRALEAEDLARAEFEKLADAEAEAKAAI